MILKYLRASIAVLAMFVMAGAALEAKDKGDKAYKLGLTAEHKEQWDSALEYYQQALDVAPNNPAYMIAARRVRFQSGQFHVNLGQKIRSQGKLDEAMTEFQKALVADPSSAIAIQEMRRTQQMIEHGKTQPGANAEDRGLTP